MGPGQTKPNRPMVTAAFSESERTEEALQTIGINWLMSDGTKGSSGEAVQRLQSHTWVD